MADARFKDLVIDATDAQALGRFWSRAAGLDLTAVEGGDVVLRDGDGPHTIWVNAVPEPRTVKQRVHLDLQGWSPEEVGSLGASIEIAREHVTVMRDPEGGEFCVITRLRSASGSYHVQKLVVDTADPEATASWWAARFGLTAEPVADLPRWRLAGGGSSGLPWPMVFDAVPEPKQVKNRVHWDVYGEVETLLGAGARRIRSRDAGIRWSVLADPEGNEFCVFDPER